MKTFKLIALIAVFCTILTAFSINSAFAEGSSATDRHSSGLESSVASAPSISVSSIFSNNMVLQRNKEIHICGYASVDGMTVTATLGSESSQCVSKDGRFDIVFPAMQAQNNLTLTISSEGSNSLTFENVDIGEVWLIGGQSNGDLRAKYLEDREEYLGLANNFNIRAYLQDNACSYEEQTNTKNGKWIQVNADNLDTVPAIGYVMATKLATEFGDDVTIAIVDVAYAGTKILAWLDVETIKAEVPTLYSQYIASKESNSAVGTSVPTACYNQMIAPLRGYVAAGVVWYQGCGDTSNKDYGQHYDLMAKRWREDFSDSNLPFFVIQLAPYFGDSEDVRNIQYDMVMNDPNSYIVSTATDGPVFSYGDFSEAWNVQGTYVHTARKSTVGLRLADQILAEVYNEKTGDYYQAPQMIDYKVNGKKVTITFDSSLYLLYGDSAVGFELSADNKTWHTAYGKIEGNQLILTSSVSDAMYVRYQNSAMELHCEDGSIIGTSKVPSSSVKTDTVNKTVTINGIIFKVNESEAVFSSFGGNLTNATGCPLPSFSIALESILKEV